MKDPKGHGSNSRGGRLARPIPGHIYHTKYDDELRYIQKDAGEAARAMRGFNSGAEGKYLDQVNDASTVLHYRSKGGLSDAPGDKAARELASGTPKSAPAPVHDAMGSAPSYHAEHVSVFDKSGAELGKVGKTATSVGASKIAGGSVELARHPTTGHYGWRKK